MRAFSISANFRCVPCCAAAAQKPVTERRRCRCVAATVALETQRATRNTVWENSRTIFGQNTATRNAPTKRSVPNERRQCFENAHTKSYLQSLQSLTSHGRQFCTLPHTGTYTCGALCASPCALVCASVHADKLAHTGIRTCALAALPTR